MSHEKVGPKEQQLRDLRAGKHAPKPKLADVRNKIAKIKPMTAKQGGRRGR